MSDEKPKAIRSDQLDSQWSGQVFKHASCECFAISPRKQKEDRRAMVSRERERKNETHGSQSVETVLSQTESTWINLKISLIEMMNWAERVKNRSVRKRNRKIGLWKSTNQSLDRRGKEASVTSSLSRLNEWEKGIQWNGVFDGEFVTSRIDD